MVINMSGATTHERRKLISEYMAANKEYSEMYHIKYDVIVGSYIEESDAKKYAESISEDYPDAKVLEKSDIGTYRISIGTYGRNEREKALEARNEHRQNRTNVKNPEKSAAWLLTSPTSKK